MFEHLTAESTRRAENVDRQRSAFEEDKSLHPYFRSANSDYKYSGFDRFDKKHGVCCEKSDK